MHQLIDHIAAEQSIESLTTPGCSCLELLFLLVLSRAGALGTGSSFRYSLRQFHKAEKDFAAQMDVHKHENISILCSNALLKGPVRAITATLGLCQSEAGKMAYTLNPSAWEAEADRSLNSKSAWSTE